MDQRFHENVVCDKDLAFCVYLDCVGVAIGNFVNDKRFNGDSVCDRRNQIL